jgi:hypothetical protein
MRCSPTYRNSCLILLCLALSFSACTSYNEPITGATTSLYPTKTTSLSVIITTRVPTQEVLTFRDLPPKATLSADRSTQVPAGVFVLKFYPPLVLDYDITLWTDESQYENQAKTINYLQAKNLETCTIGPIGPSGFYPFPDEIVQLNGVNYQVKTLERPRVGFVSTYYFEDNSLTGYDYDIGIIVLEVQASPDEWSQCKNQAEIVLATLHTK